MAVALSQPEIQNPAAWLGQEPFLEGFYAWLEARLGTVQAYLELYYKILGMGIFGDDRIAENLAGNTYYQEFLGSGQPTPEEYKFGQLPPEEQQADLDRRLREAVNTLQTTGEFSYSGNEDLQPYLEDMGYELKTTGLAGGELPQSNWRFGVPEAVEPTAPPGEDIGRQPEIQSIGGYDYQVAYDTEGNISSYRYIGRTPQPDPFGMSEYQSEQIRLEEERLALQGRETGAQRSERLAFEASQFTNPEDFITKWEYENMLREAEFGEKRKAAYRKAVGLMENTLNFRPGTQERLNAEMAAERAWDALANIKSFEPSGPPPAPAFPEFQELTGITAGQPISPQRVTAASGQTLSRMAPSEVGGITGMVNWSAGKVPGAFASAADYWQQVGNLLPKAAPRGTVRWNPSPYR